MLDGVDRVGDAHGRRAVRHEHDGLARALLVQRFQDDRLVQAVEIARRLVKEQNIRIQKQNFCQRRALLFAARKVVGVTVKQLCQLAEGNDLCQPVGLPLRFR